MDRRQLHAMTDAALVDMIKELQKEQERRVRQQREDWRRDLQERLDWALMHVGELDQLGMEVTVEIDGDGNDRIINLTDFVKIEDSNMKVVLRPVLGGD